MSATSPNKSYTRSASGSASTKEILQEQATIHTAQQEKVVRVADKADDLTTIQPRTKPNFVLPSKLGSVSLHDRLQSFLPQMQQSNKRLANGEVKSMEDVDENEQHIVMDLGLGVLEQQSSSGSSSSSSDEDSDGDDRSEVKPTAMDTLLGKTSTKEKPDIQEIS